MTDDPTGDLLPEVREKYPDRFSQETNPPNVYYNFLNVTIPPFDKQEAREAFNYAVDSRALIRIFGGRLQPGCNFLPPGVIGHEELDCKYGDPNGPPDIEKAKELVKQSGYEGEPVTFWTQQQGPAPGDRQLLRRRAERDRLRRRARDAQPAGLLWGGRPGAHEGPGRVHQLAAGLPAPGRLHRGAAEHALAPVRGHVQLRPRERPEVSTRSSTSFVARIPRTWPTNGPSSTSTSSTRRPGWCRTAARRARRSSRSGWTPRTAGGTHPVYKNDWLQFCLKD